ncbi:MAG TPA: glutamyl-tRNA reductase [Ktedonobacteraceae bacterium]
MHIVAVGVDHSTAPIGLRERLVGAKRQLPEALRDAYFVVREHVLLATCYRFEVYAISPDIDEGRTHLLRILSETCMVELTELQAHCFFLSDEEAVRHLFEVACGLQSLVPGESQIQGQVVQALELAQGSGCAGPITSALFRAAIVAGKRARSETGVGRHSASVSSVAVQLARQLFPTLNEASVLLIGTGQMSELAARNLCDNGARRLTIINRTRRHAVELSQRLGAVQRSFYELAEALAEADVVISSTTAPRAIITLELMQEVVQRSAGRSLLLIDIALPRDVEPEVGTLPGIHLYNLDDLQASVDVGISLRLQEVERVQSIIAQEVSTFERWLRSLSVVDAINDLRHYADALREQELARTMQQLPLSLTEREAAAVQELSTRLVNKLLHKPLLRLKDAAADGQGHVYTEALRYLFDLEVKSDEANHHRDASQQTGVGTDTGNGREAAPALARPVDNY